MKTTISLNRKIPAGAPLGGDLLAHCACDLEIDVSKPEAIAEQIRIAGNVCRLAIEHQIKLERDRNPVANHGADPGDVDGPDEDLRPGDPAYERNHRNDDRDRAPADDYRRNDAPPRRTDRERYDDRGGGRRRGNDGGGPVNGKQLFGFAKDNDALAWFSAFGKRRNYPQQFNDWERDEVADAMHEYWAKGRQSANGNGRH